MTATMIKTPERSLRQRREALEKANRVRSTRAEFKRQVKRTRGSIVPVLEAPPAEFESMRVFDLLVAAPKVGRVKAAKLLKRAGVAPSKTLAGVSPRQRSELLTLVKGAQL